VWAWGVVCLSACARGYMCVSCVRACVCACVCLFACHVRLCVSLFICVEVGQRDSISKLLYRYICIHIHVFRYIHIHIHTYVYISMYIYMFTYVQMQQCRMTLAEWSKHLKRAGVDKYLHRECAHNTPFSTPRSLVKTPADSPSLHSRVPSMCAHSIYPTHTPNFSLRLRFTLPHALSRTACTPCRGYQLYL